MSLLLVLLLAIIQDEQMTLWGLSSISEETKMKIDESTNFLINVIQFEDSTIANC